VHADVLLGAWCGADGADGAQPPAVAAGIRLMAYHVYVSIAGSTVGERRSQHLFADCCAAARRLPFSRTANDLTS
jgi:hypothetical protein